MQLNLYIFNQLFRTCMALITVLISIIWLFQSIRLLEFVVDKGASVGEFFAMSVASMPLWLMITVPISGFIAVNWVFSRILADRELTVMQAVGLSPFQLAKAPIALGLVLSAFLTINSVYILPSSFQTYKDLQFKLRHSIPTVLLREGVFIEIVDGLTMFIGKRGDNDVLQDIFIHDTRTTDRVITMTAESGKFVDRDGVPTLILQNGERSEGDNEGQTGAVLLFESYSLSITQKNDQPTERQTIDMNEDSIRNLLSPELATTPKYFLQRHAEAHYRMASPWLGLALTMLSAALILKGQIRRDLWSKRVMANVCACVLVIICVVISRGWTSNQAALWPLIYLSIITPIGVAGWHLISPKTPALGMQT